MVYFKILKNNFRNLTVISLLVISSLILIVACGESRAKIETPLKIGMLNSMTGDLSDFGKAHKRSAELAIEHINAVGGVGGFPVELIIKDTQTNATVGVDAANALIAEGVPAYVGALASSVTMPVATTVSSQKNIVQISAASTSPAITALADNDFLFRTTVSDAFQGQVLARLAKENYSSAGVIYVNNPYGEGLAKQFKTTFEAEGGKVTAMVPHEQTQPSYKSELSKATAGKPDVLVALSYPESAEVYLREALEGNYIKTFLFADGTKSPDMFAKLGWDKLEGSWGTNPGSPKTGSSTKFIIEYEKKYGEKPPLPYMGETYDAVVLIALAAAKGNSTTDGTAIRDALRSVACSVGERVGPGINNVDDKTSGLKRGFVLAHATEKDRWHKVDYEGAAGKQCFDANGDVAGDIEYWQIEGGKIVSKGFRNK